MKDRSPEDERSPHEVLGVSEGAPFEEIQEAYLFLVSTYGQDSFAAYRAVPEESRKAILREIEDAYQTLKSKEEAKEATTDQQTSESGDPPAQPQQKEKARKRDRLLHRMASLLNEPKTKKLEKTDDATEAPAGTAGQTPGEILRGVRKARGISLADVAASTRIKTEFLQAIEEDAYNDLPPGAYRRLMLIAYARTLNIKPDSLLKQFERLNG